MLTVSEMLRDYSGLLKGCLIEFYGKRFPVGNLVTITIVIVIYYMLHSEAL